VDAVALSVAAAPDDPRARTARLLVPVCGGIDGVAARWYRETETSVGLAVDIAGSLVLAFDVGIPGVALERLVAQGWIAGLYRGAPLSLIRGTRSAPELDFGSEDGSLWAWLASLRIEYADATRHGIRDKALQIILASDADREK